MHRSLRVALQGRVNSAKRSPQGRVNSAKRSPQGRVLGSIN
ncbi:hypothetical protein [Leptospira noguchii]|nr:hypothetical protein [Leptospira noguchii]